MHILRDTFDYAVRHHWHKRRQNVKQRLGTRLAGSQFAFNGLVNVDKARMEARLSAF